MRGEKTISPKAVESGAGSEDAGERRYRTIVADPPWPIKWRAAPAIGVRHLEYSTLPISEIAALPILDWADEVCQLFLWTTNAYLPEALGLIRLWKFEYRFLWTWCKPTGLGGHPRVATEHIVIATRGSVPQQLDRKAPQTLNWLEAPTSAHSEKPEVFMDLIERVSPGPYLELFARRDRIGWDTWGDQSLGTADSDDFDHPGDRYLPSYQQAIRNAAQGSGYA